MQREYTEKTDIFSGDGTVKCGGWAKTPLLNFNSNQSRQNGHIREHDCYFIGNSEVSLYISVENAGLDFNIKIAVADLKSKAVYSDYVIKKQFPSKLDLPESGSSGELVYTDKRVQLQLTNAVDSRFLKCDFIDFGDAGNLYFNINLKKSDGESMNQIAPFERDRRYFYYKRFVPRFTASGIVRLGGKEYALDKSDSTAYFDMTRYSKPRKSGYQRLSSDFTIDGTRFSLCLASKIGDNRAGTESCYFYNGKLFKLGKIEVRSSSGKINRPWYFRGGASEFDITFNPLTVEGRLMAADFDKTFVVFGKIYGEIKRDDFDDPLSVNAIPAHMVFSEF